MSERDREDSVFALEPEHAVDKSAQRLLGRAIRVDHAAIEGRHHRACLAFSCRGKDAEEVFGSFLDINVRIFFVHDQRRGMAHHRVRNVPMKVEFRPYRHSFADDAANPFENVALAIIIPLDYHGAVQRQEHHVNRQRAPQVG
jgi:hypothetical protein